MTKKRARSRLARLFRKTGGLAWGVAHKFAGMLVRDGRGWGLERWPWPDEVWENRQCCSDHGRQPFLVGWRCPRGVVTVEAAYAASGGNI